MQTTLLLPLLRPTDPTAIDPVSFSAALALLSLLAPNTAAAQAASPVAAPLPNFAATASTRRNATRRRADALPSAALYSVAITPPALPSPRNAVHRNTIPCDAACCDVAHYIIHATQTTSHSLPYSTGNTTSFDICIFTTILSHCIDQQCLLLNVPRARQNSATNLVLIQQDTMLLYVRMPTACSATPWQFLQLFFVSFLPFSSDQLTG